MDALPLKDPHGEVRAWCCGVCGSTETPRPQKLREMSAIEIADASRVAAASCCQCRRCGRARAKDRTVYCDACVPRPAPLPPDPGPTCPVCGLEAEEGEKVCMDCQKIGGDPPGWAFAIRRRNKAPTRHLVPRGQDGAAATGPATIALCGAQAKRRWQLEPTEGLACPDCLLAMLHIDAAQGQLDAMAELQREAAEPDPSDEAKSADAPADETAELAEDPVAEASVADDEPAAPAPELEPAPEDAAAPELEPASEDATEPDHGPEDAVAPSTEPAGEPWSDELADVLFDE